MEIRFINTWMDSMPMFFEALSVRAALLIGNYVSLAGEPAHNLTLAKQYQQLTLKERMSIVKAYSIKKKKLHQLEDLDMFEALLTRLDKIKHKSKDDFIKLKQLEAQYNKELYETTIAIVLLEHKIDGYNGLLDTVDTTKLATSLFEFSCRGINASKANATKTAQKVLDFIFAPPSNIDEVNILMVPGYFLDDSEKNTIKQTLQNGASTDNELVDVNKIINSFHLGLRLPPLRQMTVFEIKTLQLQLKDLFKTLNLSINDWINILYENSLVSTPSKEKIAEVIKNAIAITNELDKSDLINISLKQKQETLIIGTSIIMGFLSISYLIDAYERFNLFDGDVIQALRTLTENNPTYPKAIPVISTLFDEWETKEQRSRKQQIESMNKPSSKKSISID